MNRKRLTRSFYTRPTLEVAKNLLGKYIIRKIGEKQIVSMITETEAYIGPGDKASHAYQGKITPRNKVEYLTGGYVYIYLVYGLYWQLNIITSVAGKPECVLIRALDKKEALGPGKLCQYLKLDKSFYGEDLTKSKRIWLEDPEPEQARHQSKARCWTSPVPKRNFWYGVRYGAGPGVKVKLSQILTTKRIGIDYAGPYWANKKWRFLLKSDKKFSQCPEPAKRARGKRFS